MRKIVLTVAFVSAICLAYSQTFKLETEVNGSYKEFNWKQQPQIESRIDLESDYYMFQELEIQVTIPDWSKEINFELNKSVKSVPQLYNLGMGKDANIMGYIYDFDEKRVKRASSTSGTLKITKLDTEKRLISGEFQYEQKLMEKSYKIRGSFTDVYIPVKNN